MKKLRNEILYTVCNIIEEELSEELNLKISIKPTKKCKLSDLDNLSLNVEYDEETKKLNVDQNTKLYLNIKIVKN